MKHKEIKSDLDPFMRVNLKEINSAGNVDTRTLIKSNEYEKKIGDSGIREVFEFPLPLSAKSSNKFFCIK